MVFFRTFPRWKNAEVAGQLSAQLGGDVSPSTLSAHQVASIASLDDFQKKIPSAGSMSAAVFGGGRLHRSGFGGGGCLAPTSSGTGPVRRRVGRRWRLASLGGRRDVLPGQSSAASCGADHRRLFGPGQGSTAHLGAGHRSARQRKSDVGLVAPFSN